MRIDPEGPDRAAEQAAFEARVRGEADEAGRGAGIGPAEGFKLIDKV
jgi:hypothetical protein